MNPTNPPAKKNAPERPDAAGSPVAPAKGEPETAETTGNVDKIRDILFGSQMRDYEKKFGRLEARLAGETAELREEIKRRFASLEAYVKNELAALADQLKLEKGERAEANKDLARELKENAKAWEKKASQIDEQMAKALRDLRQHVLEETKRLTDEMEQKHKMVSAALDNEGQELRASLTDRLALADLFAEVSLRLKNEFKVPAKK
jgi:chromosome segregation ATPase